MIEETIQELEAAMGKAHEALRRDLAKLRTGRASPEVLDSIRVDYYGTPTPIGQMASVTVPEPRMMMVKPWDKTALPLIEKAIMISNTGLNPQNDGEIIRLPVPPLTEERRKEIVKVARDHGEKCKVAIRSVRHDARDILEAMKKDGDAGEDEIERAMKRVESAVQGGNTVTDEIVSKKEKDILTV